MKSMFFQIEFFLLLREVEVIKHLFDTFASHWPTLVRFNHFFDILVAFKFIGISTWRTVTVPAGKEICAIIRLTDVHS